MRVGVPCPSSNDDGQKEQDCGAKMGRRSGLVGAEKVNSELVQLMKLRGGAYADSWGNKKVGFSRLGGGLIQQAGSSLSPFVTACTLPGLNGIDLLGPRPDTSRSPNAQKDVSGLKKSLKVQQVGSHNVSTIGGASLYGLNGPELLGLKQSGPFKRKRALKLGHRGNMGLKKGLKEARLGPKGVKSCSKEEMRLEDGGFRPSAEGSSDPLVDPTWICVRAPLLHFHEGRPDLVENFSFKSCWEEGLWVVSSDCPLMGYSCQGPGEEGFPAGRSFDLVESVSRFLEVEAPEALRNHANGSRFEVAPSDDCSSPIFSVFGRPLLSGGSSGLGDFHGHEALGEMELLKVVSVDGREWGEGTTDALMEVDQATVGLRPLRE